MDKQKIGEFGEGVAIKYLKKKGYIIVKANYRCRFGEIDIVAKDRNTYVFIEVKTRRDSSYGRPVEAINNKKINHIMKTIQFYLKENNLYEYDLRIDAIEVLVNNFKNIKINHIRNIVN